MWPGLNQLWKAQTVVMDAQNHAWEVIQTMAAKVDKLSNTVDAFIKSLNKPNGKE